MALEVGRLVARIDIEGSFEQQLARARTNMEELAATAGRLDQSVRRVGDSGRALTVSPNAERQLVRLNSTARDYGVSLRSASDTGRSMSVSGSAERQIVRLNSTARDYGVSLRSASDTGRNLSVSSQPALQLSQTASMASQVDSRFAGLGVTMRGLAVAATGAVAAAAGIGTIMTKGWDRITAIDTAQGKLRGLGHEASSVADIMTSATAAVTGTAYGLGDAASIAANAVAAGIQPGKDLTKYLTMTADASAIAGVSLGEMGRILNQVQTGQSAYAGDLSQLADRGIPIYQWLADEAGVAASEIKKLASEGQISSEMLFSAIQNNIGGAAQEMGGTLVGSLANVGAAFGRLGASVIDPFKGGIMSAAEGVQEFAGALSKVLGPAASVAADGLGVVGAVIGKIPGPVTAAVAALVALKVTGLGAAMATAATTAATAIRGVGTSIAIASMLARSSVASNGLAAASLTGLGIAAKGAMSMLGGPWMIGLAGAALVVSNFASAAKSASDTQNRLKEITGEHAAAQVELAEALMRSNGLLDEQASSAATTILQKSLDEIETLAGEKADFMTELASGIQNASYKYEDYANNLRTANNEDERGLAQRQMSRLEFQAMGDAAAEAGVNVDDIARIAQEGGPKWDALRQALLNTEGAGAAVVAKLESGRGTIEGIVAAATEAEIASMALADAFRVMADESSTAEDKADALKAALNALAGDTMTSDEALFAYYGTLDKVGEASQKLAEGTGAFAREIEGGGLEFDHASERSEKLRDALLEMRDATADAAGAGVDMGPIWERNRSEMEKLAAQTPYTAEQLWELADAALGFSEMDIQATVGIRNGGEVLGQLGNISSALRNVEEGATVEVKKVGDDALAYLQSVGYEAKRIEGTSNIRVTAQTAEANAGLQATLHMAANLAKADPNVDISTNADAVSVLLGIAREKVNELPDGNVEIDHDIPGLMELLQQLGIKTAEPKNGKLLIDSADVDRARNHALGLNNVRTMSTHTVMIDMINNTTLPAPSQALQGLDQFTRADGGIDGIRSFADGGMLPDSARIERPKGTSGLVQWAEAETGGEAFIPLAASKRQRSRKIWAATGKLLGIDVGGLGEIASFANGGVVEGMTSLVGKKFPALKATSTYRTSNDHHGGGKAVDFSNGSDNTPEQLALANYIADNFPNSLELIYSHPGFDRNIKDGKYVGDGVGFYGPGTMAGHRNHVHWAMSEPPSEDTAKASTLGWSTTDTRSKRDKNIDAIVEEGMRRGLSDDDIMTALMVAEQESGTRVLANPADPASMGMSNEGVGNDHDSTGIFQQRNNGAWGTLEDRMDPTKSAGMFYDELSKVEGRENMRKTEVAQKVQKSAYPDAYAKHEAKAAEMLSASKSRLSTMGGSGANGGDGQRVYVTNWPGGGFSSGGSSSGGGGGVGNSGDTSVIKEGSIADVLLRAAGQDPNAMFPTGAVSGKEKQFDDTKIMEKEGDIEAAKEQARIAKLKLDELKNKTNAKGERVAPSASALSAAELRASEAERKVEKLEHDLRELRRKSDEVRAHNQSIGVDVENYANGGFHGLENHAAHIAPAGSWRVFGEPETGGEAYIPLASHKRARSTAILAETARRMGYSLGAGVNLVGSVLTGNGLDTGWGGPSLDEIGIDTGALRDSLSPGVTAEAERAGQQIAAILQNLGATVDQQVEGTLSQVSDGQRQLRQQYARAMI